MTVDSLAAMAAATPIPTSTRPWQRLAPPAFIVIITLILMAPVALGPTLNHESFWIDHVWASQFSELLREGTLYPRWLPWSHDGLGSPVFYYYPPLAFYLTGALELAGMSTYGSIIAAFGLAFAASGIGCWLWLRNMPHALVGALFFTIAPYHWFNFTMRGALAESVAIAFLPLLAIGLRRIRDGEGWGGAALAYAALIMSHLPLALLTSVFFIAPYALLHRRQLPRFALASAIGIGLAAIYLVPALGLARFREAELLWAMPHLRPDFWSLYAANWRSHHVGYVHLTILWLSVPALSEAIGSLSRWAWYALAILAIALGLIPLLWSLPLLRDVQFSFRVLPLAELAIAAAIAGSRLTPVTRVAALSLPLLWTTILIMTPHEAGPDRAAVVNRHLDVVEYLPPGTTRSAEGRPWLETPRAGRVPPPVHDGWVVEPIFYFPSWSCGVPEPQTKLLMHRPDCTPRLIWTDQERIGGAISLVALLSLVACGLISRRRRLLARGRSTA